MRTSNPALNSKTFSGFQGAITEENRMTLLGTVNKTYILLLLLVASAATTWWLTAPLPDVSFLWPWLLGTSLVAFGVALVTVRNKQRAAITGPIYVVLEGVIVGALSMIFEQTYPGIVLQAVGLTFGILFVLLLIYSTGVIKVTDNFRLGVVAATGAIALLYLVTFGLQFFGVDIAFVHDASEWGIAFNLFVIVIAALNLVLDFDFIESGVKQGAPKFMEWYAAFGLMVTLIWLYIEILRLLGRSRRRGRR